MSSKQTFREPLPVGYAYYNYDRSSPLLALPEAVKNAVIAEQDAQAAALKRQEEAAEAEALEQAKQFDREKRESERAHALLAKLRQEEVDRARDGEPTRAEQLHIRQATHRTHRVLTHPEQLDDALRSYVGDDDRRKQRSIVLERLSQLGPYRELAQPERWEKELAELLRDMPNFAAPIALLERYLALAEVSTTPVRIPPMLLLGPPGVGKSLFSARVAELMGTDHGSIAFDQPTFGGALHGLDKHWANAESGMLFNMVCLGTHANPVILLDELDKAGRSGYRDQSPLAQLHGALEPQTARRTKDLATDIEFDAGLVTYIAAANSLDGIGVPLLSRFEIFEIGHLSPDESVHVARQVVRSVVERMGLLELFSVEKRAYYVLARMSPRLMVRTVEKLLGQAVLTDVHLVTEAMVWAEVETEPQRTHVH